jgi:hypothetical protein
METELKFQVPRGHRQALRQAVATASASTTRLQAVYADTPGQQLAAAGLALRLRKEGPVWVQTLKGRGDGLMQRLEHEVRLPAQRGIPTLDPQRHAGTAAGDKLLAVLAAPGGGAALQPVYRTDIQRLHRRVRHGGALIELGPTTGATSWRVKSACLWTKSNSNWCAGRLPGWLNWRRVGLRVTGFGGMCEPSQSAGSVWRWGARTCPLWRLPSSMCPVSHRGWHGRPRFRPRFCTRWPTLPSWPAVQAAPSMVCNGAARCISCVSCFVTPRPSCLGKTRPRPWDWCWQTQAGHCRLQPPRRRWLAARPCSWPQPVWPHAQAR